MLTMTGEAVSTRFHPRVGANLMVKLKVNGRAVSIRSTDLSMAGLCLQGDFPELADQVTLAIPLPDDKHVPGRKGSRVAPFAFDEGAERGVASLHPRASPPQGVARGMRSAQQPGMTALLLAVLLTGAPTQSFPINRRDAPCPDGGA